MEGLIGVVVLAFLVSSVAGHSLPQLLTGCPNGWIAYEGSCYLFNNKDMMSFVMAEAFCSQKGGHVVHVDDEDENNFIKDAVRAYPSNSFKLWWIGMQDMVDGVWKYTSDNSPVTFFDWAPNEPNGGSSADCAVLYADRNYSWADHVCVIVGDYTAYAICEAKYMKSYWLQ